MIENECPKCFGYGWNIETDRHDMQIPAQCEYCFGRGYLQDKPMKENIVEKGWLIESTATGSALWWTGVASTMKFYAAKNGSSRQWTSDSFEAVRFSRKVDADAVILGVFGLSPNGENGARIIATEHVWH